MSDKKTRQTRSTGAVIVAVLILVIGFAIYAITGEDILGIFAPQEPTAVPAVTVAPPSGDVELITLGQGRGASKGFWQVYFTEPSGSRDRTTYTGGVEDVIAAAIDGVQNTLDIAAFELNSEAITEAITAAHDRGVTVRIVTDDEHGIEDDDSTLLDLEDEGIAIVDDDRSALMHNKFMIMDGATVWMGSMNYTVNGVYRNNNNALMLRSRRAVETYQAEFDEMFERGEFGPRSDPANTADFQQDGTPIEIYFAAENEVVDQILDEINAAEDQIRFMAFSFTRDDLADAMLAAAERGVDLRGIFETTGSQTRFSELTRLACAGFPMRQDGSPFILHHKVIVIDDDTVINGSFNFSDSAVDSNDENVVIIKDRDLAVQYLAEWDRLWTQASPPEAGDIDCG